MTEERCAAVIERFKDGSCETCDFGHFVTRGFEWTSHGQPSHPFLGRPIRLCGLAKERHDRFTATGITLLKHPHKYLPALPCETCHGEGKVFIAETGEEAVTWLQGDDPPNAPCPYCLLGLVVKEESRA